MMSATKKVTHVTKVIVNYLLENQSKYLNLQLLRAVHHMCHRKKKYVGGGGGVRSGEGLGWG